MQRQNRLMINHADSCSECWGGGGEACSVGCSVPDNRGPSGGAQGSLRGWLKTAAPTPPLLLLPAALGTHASASKWLMVLDTVCLSNWNHWKH